MDTDIELSLTRRPLQHWAHLCLSACICGFINLCLITERKTTPPSGSAMHLTQLLHPIDIKIDRIQRSGRGDKQAVELGSAEADIADYFGYLDLAD